MPSQYFEERLQRKLSRPLACINLCISILLSSSGFCAVAQQTLWNLPLAQQQAVAPMKAMALLDKTGRELHGPVSLGDSTGVTDDSVLFGQSGALSGSSAVLGRGIRLGINTAFNEINKRDGVHGRKLSLITLDDGYTPERAIENTHKLLKEEKVFALAGAVGTSPVRASIPIAAAEGAPFIGPVTGNASLRNARWPNMVHLRASYGEETEAMVRHLVADLGVTRIAVMYQDDYFGRDAYEGIRLVLGRRQLEPVASGVYERNTNAIKTALMDIQKGNPEAVILVGSHDAVSNFVLWARYTGLDPIFMAISFVGIQALTDTLGPDGAGVFVTQVVPFPSPSEIPVTTSFLQALAAFSPDTKAAFTSFEGYLIGRLIIEGLQNAGRFLTRENFLAYFKQERVVDLGGFRLYYGRRIDQGSDSVYLTAINGSGRYQPVRKLTDIVKCVNC